MSRKIGILGGTFNPIHKGHIYLAERLKEAKALDEIWLIPAYINPFKQSEPPILCRHRLKMCELAISGKKGYEVLDIECEVPKTSYTYHTLVKLKEKHPEDNFFLLLGEDTAKTLSSWYKADDLIQIAKPLIGSRSKEDFCKLLPKDDPFCKLLEKGFVPFEPLLISSREIREKLERGEPVEQFVDPSVLSYIEKYHLYQSK